MAGLVVPPRTAGVPLLVLGQAGVSPANAALELAVYRVVQEALTNALRYAPDAGHVTGLYDRLRVVHYAGQGRRRRNGAPMRRSRPGHVGLIGMAERGAVFGGTVEAGPAGTVDGGFHV